MIQKMNNLHISMKITNLQTVIDLCTDMKMNDSEQFLFNRLRKQSLEDRTNYPMQFNLMNQVDEISLRTKLMTTEMSKTETKTASLKIINIFEIIADKIDTAKQKAKQRTLSRPTSSRSIKTTEIGPFNIIEKN
jgi:hypothetical protein